MNKSSWQVIYNCKPETGDIVTIDIYAGSICDTTPIFSDVRDPATNKPSKELAAYVVGLHNKTIEG